MKVPKTLDEIYFSYLTYRKKSGLKNSPVITLKQFWLDCKKFSNHEYLTKEMVDAWIAKRPTETPFSNYTRSTPIINFLKYANGRGWLDFDVPKVKSVTHRGSIPHAFTQEELTNFFNACDEIKSRRSLVSKLKRIEVPVFFRLLYSSGMRTLEARWLRNNDVDLKNGIIYIRHSKGYGEHIVVLHDNMLELMRCYDKTVSRLIPDRLYFFPSQYKDKCHWSSWVQDMFHEMWFKYNTATSVVPYQLRHHYAITNINRWSDGYDIHEYLVALSKSMGHRTLESTLYYYSLVPRLKNQIEEMDGKRLNHIIPDLPDEEE